MTQEEQELVETMIRVSLKVILAGSIKELVEAHGLGLKTAQDFIQKYSKALMEWAAISMPHLNPQMKAMFAEAANKGKSSSAILGDE